MRVIVILRYSRNGRFVDDSLQKSRNSNAVCRLSSSALVDVYDKRQGTPRPTNAPSLSTSYRRVECIHVWSRARPALRSGRGAARAFEIASRSDSTAGANPRLVEWEPASYLPTPLLGKATPTVGLWKGFRWTRHRLLGHHDGWGRWHGGWVDVMCLSSPEEVRSDVGRGCRCRWVIRRWLAGGGGAIGMPNDIGMKGQRSIHIVFGKGRCVLP